MQEETKKVKSDVALREEKILEFWRENKTFEKSLEKNSPKGHYVFYDGPPFATGQIHYGHILGSTVKDVIGRYKTMQGFYVPRKWGWDCHGLPIENIVEKELGIAGHKEIEKYGIDKFVEYARSKVLQYDKDWERGIERIGRWVDFRGQYKTMDNTFIESVWWALSEFNKKNLIYEGVRVLAYCARCETPIANSEIAMDNSYRDISDISVYTKFELEDDPSTSSGQGPTYLLAWTTTPWTLPGNTAIAINKNIVYIKIKVGDEILILAKETLQNVLKDKEYTVLGEVKGEELIGKKYKPVFPYYKNTDVANNENIWKVWHADFVTIEKGTGIAHEAPAFGEDDMNLAKANNIPWIIHVDETGRFKPEVVDFVNMQVKPKGIEKDDHQKADIEVIKYLAKNNFLFAKEKIIHSYPHCMRCDTPIIYYALPSWFINITKAKGDIKNQAKNINWVPSHLKEGRFKNIVENAPDWNISRNRYWASPLPIWKCEKCKEKTFVSSIEDLKNKTKKSRNTYYVIRHGEAENNIESGVNYKEINHSARLTEKGKEQILESSKNFKEKVDIIISSPFNRAKETTKIVCEQINFPIEKVIYDERVQEWETSSLFEGKERSAFNKYYDVDYLNNPNEVLPNGESFVQLIKRVGNFIYEIEEKYSGKNILIIGHQGATRALSFIVQGLSLNDLSSTNDPLPFLRNAEIKEFKFVPLPHNANYELDLHRPYIDEIKLTCKCGENLVRIPEVLDCWFESGSMPFAQDHYPFDNKNWQRNNFPAGFVAEYIAQTRTWFYYTHVVSTILFGKTPFRNIVSTGTLRAEDGEKMSKSKSNYPDPWIFIDKYGVDALRIYLMSSTLMKGEDANFSEKAVQDIASKIVGRLFNVLSFYELYPIPEQPARQLAGGAQYGVRDILKSENVLDKWILVRFDDVVEQITLGMENYDMAEATRPLDLFIDDLSTWYLRRSRERIKEGNSEARQTLYFVLKTFAKVIAPFAPFAGEEIYLKLKQNNEPESVHLESWPEIKKKSFFSKLFKSNSGENKILIENMEYARKIVTLGLEARQKVGFKVRQPLASLKLKVKSRKLSSEYFELIKNELNVKEIIFDNSIPNEVELDKNITEELKQEGYYRELVRAVQDMRKKMGLTPSDIINLFIETSDDGKKLIQKFETEMKKVVLAPKIEFLANAGEEIKIDELVFKVKIEK